MITLEEMWESLRQNPETKATMEEVEKSYKLFKKIENLIVADLESKLEEKTRVAEGYSELFDKKQHENYQQFCEIQELKKQLEYISKNKYEERLSAYERKINQLKQQLAEKEDAIKYLKGIKRYDIGEMITANIKLKQSQNQTAIAELEKLKNYLPNIALDIPDMVSYRYLKKQIDQQIRVLKGESR